MTIFLIRVMMDETIWAVCLAELPGVGYVPPEHVERPPLKAGAATPEIHRYDFDSKEHVSLWWTTPEGGASASPASRWFSRRESGEAGTEEILDYLYRGLEYPGTPSDYHFAIQNAHEALWKRRRVDPAAVQAVERLCLLDLALVEAYPEMLRLEYDGEVRYAAILAFERLIKLYERAGDIEAALNVARRAQRFGQDRGGVERLEAKMNAFRLFSARIPTWLHTSSWILSLSSRTWIQTRSQGWDLRHRFRGSSQPSTSTASGAVFV